MTQAFGFKYQIWPQMLHAILWQLRVSDPVTVRNVQVICIYNFEVVDIFSTLNYG